jgi:hypothetical protein
MFVSAVETSSVMPGKPAMLSAKRFAFAWSSAMRSTL